MKSRLLILILVLVALALSACGQFRTAADQDGEACPTATPETQLLTNEEHGYCLLYPNEYQIEKPNENSTAILVGSLLDVEHPKVFIEVQDAAGRSAEQAADEIETNIVPAGFEIERSSDLQVGGEAAVVLDKLPGQDTNRQVVFVHDGRLYKLTFLPASEDYGEIYRQMEVLYDTVIQSFHFLPQN